MVTPKRFRIDDLWTSRDPLPGRAMLSVIAKRLGEAWGFRALTALVQIAYNPRLRSTLGRAFLDEGRIELNPLLLREYPEELLDVLAHELAHIIVYVRYGSVAPHGKQFRTLMRTLNLATQATHSLPIAHLRTRRRKYLYLHSCSICGYRFTARRVRWNYYCITCGPKMTWDVFRAPDTRAGRKELQGLRT